jgi:serine/threonine protein kinase/dipeptidyl aminopeptidase/acylaminoacyl peptidase
MNSEKWERAKKLYEAALKIGRAERPRFLAENSAGDEEVLREVESLLACSDEASGFLETPAIGEIAESLISSKSLAGQKILQYEVLRLLGAGGMGEVYLAEDTRLRRRIALKILPPSLGGDRKSVQRFEQEACAASALNHPNILTVHEFGEHNGMNFIASEFVNGETLRERLRGGVKPALSETLDIALQVAAALRAAHASGIIHRDIKPENIMVRDDGLVKVLDFGLAKLTSQPLSSGAKDDRQVQTTAGLIMGTASYMSPEQARGQAIDARTDTWSFGVVLYEMLAGKLPFKGETTSDTIASILTSEPDFASIVLPSGLIRILRKALQKDAAGRYQSAADLLTDLEAFKQASQVTPSSGMFGPDTGSTASTSESRGNGETRPIEDRSDESAGAVASRPWFLNRKLIAACSLLIVLGGAAAVWKMLPKNRAQMPTDLASMRVKQLIAWDAEAGESNVGAKFSPNGTMIAYSLIKNGLSNIWTRQVPEGKSNAVTDGKWNYYNPIWSPDGQRIAFISDKDNQLAIWAMPFAGGELTYIAAVENRNIFLLKWSRNGEKIYFQQGDPKTGLNVFTIDMASKQVTRITNFDIGSPEQFFSISPDEERIAYSSGSDDGVHIFVIPVKGGAPQQVTNDSEATDGYPFWLPDGRRIIYSSKRNGIFQTCIAFLDEGRTEQINLGISDTLISDVAPDGSKILLQQSREESDLWRVDIDGKNETRITSEIGLELWPDVSPDGKDIVFQETTESQHLLESSVLIRSLDGGQQINIASNGFSPAFSPDSRKVAFLRSAGNFINLYITDRTGANERQLTTEGVWFPGYTLMPYNRLQVKDYRWFPDGNSLIYSAKKDGVWNVFRAAADGSGAPVQISSNTDENVRLFNPVVEPNGKRIAWTSTPVADSSKGKKTTDLYLWDESGARVLFSSESITRLIGWTGNNLVLAAVDGGPIAKPVKALLTMVSIDRRHRDLALVDAMYFNNIALSPDGRRIAFATREGGRDNIKIISAAGGGSAGITANNDPTIYVSGIAWSSDGAAVYFGKQKQVGMISVIENFK